MPMGAPLILAHHLRKGEGNYGEHPSSVPLPGPDSRNRQAMRAYSYWSSARV